MLLEGRKGKSILLLQGGESAQKKGSWMIHRILRQQQMPAIGLKCGLDWSHPSGRKSSTGMAPSILRQLWELLDKAADIVPVKYAWRHFGNPISFKSAHLEHYHTENNVQDQHHDQYIQPQSSMPKNNCHYHFQNHDNLQLPGTFTSDFVPLPLGQ